MLKKLKTLLSLFLVPALHAQPPLSSELQALAFKMRTNNLYHQLVWDFAPTNSYTFNQDNGTITYTNDAEKTIVAEVEIMGSFFLGDKTFLWADKNKSVDTRWCTQVNGFRELLPEPCRVPKFNTTVDYLRMLSAAFGGHLKANAVDYVRQDETIIFFALKKVEIFEQDKLVKTIAPGMQGIQEYVPEKTALLEEFMDGYVQINQQYNKHNNESKGFDALDSLKALYIDDPNEGLSLQKPFKHTNPYGQEFKGVGFEDLPGRVFILFSTREQPWPNTHKAYEINPEGKGKKIFLRSFDVYGL
jgi:hypothetical protein